MLELCFVVLLVLVVLFTGGMLVRRIETMEARLRASLSLMEAAIKSSLEKRGQAERER